MLGGELPINFRHRIWIEQRFGSRRGIGCALIANSGIDHDVSDMDSFRPKLAGNALSEPAQRKFRATEGNRGATYRRSCPGEQNSSGSGLEHFRYYGLSAKQASQGADRPTPSKILGIDRQQSLSKWASGAGVKNQEIDWSQCVPESGKGPLHLVSVTHICLGRGHWHLGCAQLSRQLIQIVLGSGDQANSASFLR